MCAEMAIHAAGTQVVLAQAVLESSDVGAQVVLTLTSVGTSSDGTNWCGCRAAWHKVVGSDDSKPRLAQSSVGTENSVGIQSSVGHGVLWIQRVR